MHILVILNFGFVLFFGIVLTLTFADISFYNNKKHHIVIFLLLGIVQIFAYIAFGYEFLFKSYPLLTHLPLFLILKFYYNKNNYISWISIFSAYLFCTPRKWSGTFLSYFWDYDPKISYLVQIIITVPLLFIILKYISPFVARLKLESTKILRFFIMVPLIYYILEYILTVYTDLLYSGSAAIIEFMDSAVVVIYFIFSIIYLKTLYEKKEIEVEQEVLKIITNQSKSEVETLRKFQKQTAIHRHDLRHHLNYLNACISSNNLNDALSYITEVNAEIDNTKVIQYCENESLNLILSSYSNKAEEKNIHKEFVVSTADISKYAISDLCSLLMNGLENALQACDKITDCSLRFIKFRMYSRNNKLCIEIRNSYLTKPEIEHGIPISKEAGHGFGTKSMVHVVEKYGGIYQFSAKDGIFIFQATT